MNKNKRRSLIANLVKKAQAKKRRDVATEAVERDTGIAMAPTLDDVDDELGRMSGFREESRDRNNVSDDELLFGVSSLDDESTETEE